MSINYTMHNWYFDHRTRQLFSQQDLLGRSVERLVVKEVRNAYHSYTLV